MGFFCGTFYSRLSIIGVVMVFFLSALAWGSPSSLNYQGRILKADGTPLVYNNVAFIFQIKGGTNGQCLIYQEQINGIDLSGSDGVFDVPIGVGSTQYPTSGSFTVLDAFNNSISSFTCGICTSSSCSASTSTYTPNSDDIRYLRVQFYDGTGWRLISPDSVIRSVPFAGYSLSAQKLGTNVASDFVLKNDVNNAGSGSVSCDSGNFLTWDASAGKFGCAAVSGASGGTVTDVTASSPLAVTNGTSTPNITIQVASGSQNGYLSSSDWTTFNNKLGASSTLSGDVSGTPSTTSVDKLKGTALSISSLSSNQVLKYSGGNWINSTLATSDISGLSSTLSGISTTLSSAVMQSQFPASCAANQTLTFSSPSGSFVCASISINGSQVSGNISGSAAGFTGSLAGDVSGTQGATSVDKIKGVAVSATTPTSNQVLTYTGGSWTPADLPSGILSGTGTAGYVPYYNTSTTLANSNIYYSGSSVGIGTSTPGTNLEVAGALRLSTTGTDSYVTPAGSNVPTKINVPYYDPGAFGQILSMGVPSTAQTNSRVMSLFDARTGSHDPSLALFSPNESQTLGFSFDGSNTLGAVKSSTALALQATSGIRLRPGTSEKVFMEGPVIMDWTSLDSDYGAFLNLTTASRAVTGVGISVHGSLGNDGRASVLIDTDESSNGRYPLRVTAQSGGVEVLAATAAGNVGIGTATPSEKLEVAGNIKGTQLCIGADCRSTWPSGSGGTVTSIVAGTGLTGGTITTSGTLAVDVGTTANKIVQLDASGKLPAVDGSALTNLNLANLNASNLTSGTVPAARMPALTGDVTSSAGSTATTLAQIQGKSVTISSLATGDFLKYNGTGWVNDPLSSADLSDASSLIKSSQMPANCAAGQTLTFSSPTGAWTCSNIVVTASNFGSQTQNTFLAAPNGSNGTPTFRTIASADLPNGTLSGSGTAGYVPYYNTATTLANSNIYNSGGNVGIGTTSPSFVLDVYGNSFAIGKGADKRSIASDTNGNLNLRPLVDTTAGVWIRDENTNAGLRFYNAGYSQIQSYSTDETTPTSLSINGAGGSVGIGTTSPGALFDIAGTTGNFQVTSDGAHLQFTRAGENYIKATGTGGGFRFVVNGGTDANGAVEIASTGNVGIGAASPLYPLDIRSVAHDGVHVTNTGGDEGLFLAGSSAGSNIQSNVGYDGTNFIAKATSASLINQTGGSINFQADSGLTVGSTYTPTFRMSIRPNGNVGIGTTAPDTRLMVVPSGATLTSMPTGWGGGIHTWDIYAEGTIAVGLNGVQAVSMSSQGNLNATGCVAYNGGTSGTCASDIRLKKDVHDFSLGLQQLLQVHPVYYKYNGLGETIEDTHDRIGVIAQEFEKAAPELVETREVKMHKDDKEKTQIKVVNYNGFTYMLINSIKEIYAQVESLFTTQDQQQREIASLKEKVQSLQDENKNIKESLCAKDSSYAFCQSH